MLSIVPLCISLLLAVTSTLSSPVPAKSGSVSFGGYSVSGSTYGPGGGVEGAAAGAGKGKSGAAAGRAGGGRKPSGAAAAAGNGLSGSAARQRVKRGCSDESALYERGSLVREGAQERIGTVHV